MFDKDYTLADMVNVKRQGCLYHDVIKTHTYSELLPTCIETIELFDDLVLRYTYNDIDYCTIVYFITPTRKYVITNIDNYDGVSVAEFKYDRTLCSIYQFDKFNATDYKEKYVMEKIDFTLRAGDMINNNYYLLLANKYEDISKWLVYGIGKNIDTVYPTVQMCTFGKTGCVSQVIIDGEVKGYLIYKNDIAQIWLWNEDKKCLTLARTNKYDEANYLITSTTDKDSIDIFYLDNYDGKVVKIKHKLHNSDASVCTYDNYSEFCNTLSIDNNEVN